MNIQNTQTQKKTPQQILEEIKQKALAIQSGLSNQSQTQTTPRAEAFNKYAEAFIPTQEEKDYQSRISSIMGKREATDIRVGDEPISAQAMAGRREMLTKEEQAQLVPMQRQLAILQGQRQASLDTQKLRYEEEKSKEESKGKTATVGKSLYQYDPTTNSYKLAVEGPKEYQSGSIGEYEYYRDNEMAAGRKPMGYNEYQTLDANRKRPTAQGGGASSGVDSAVIDAIIQNPKLYDGLSPTERAKHLPELAKMGFTGEVISEYQVERSGRTIGVIDNLIKKAEESPGIFGRTAALPIPDWMRSDAFRNYKYELVSLAANIFATELTAMREASKTGGAVGNVSDAEGERFANAIGALNMAQSYEEIVKQLGIAKDSLTKWRDAIKKYQADSGNNEENELLKAGYTPEQIQQIKSAQ